MARRACKLVLSCLRAHLLLFTILLALSETNALLGCPRLPGSSKKNCFRVLWALSVHSLHMAHTRRYLTASLMRRRKRRACYTKHLLMSSEVVYRG